jgi:predicted P-loop ATPase
MKAAEVVVLRPQPGWLNEWVTDERGQPHPNLANCLIALRRDPALNQALAFDEMERSVIVVGALPGHGPDHRRLLDDASVGRIQEHLQLIGLRRISRETVQRAVEQRARDECAFHPVREYLAGLSWDGKPRIDSWLSDYLGAEANEYHARIGQMFLVAMVARVMEPGCKADYMVILEGPQGAKKSTACSVLGDPWFSDGLPDISGGKDALLHLRGRWLIEVAEMHAMSSGEAGQLKAFITRRVERYRPPYGHNEVVEPRQCVFIGTTNKSVYLRDPTGGRRFWPVKVGQIAIDKLARDRDQLLAEAAKLYHERVRWWPDRAFEAEHIAPQQELRYEHDPWEEKIADYLDGKVEVTVGDVGSCALHIEDRRLTTKEVHRITDILERRDWTRGAKNSKGRIPWRRRA